jgi:hypothetical protein
VTSHDSGAISTDSRAPRDTERGLLTGGRETAVPLAIRCINFVALIVLTVILVPAAAVRLSQVIVVLTVLSMLIGFYWLFQHNAAVSALHLSLSFSLILWILVCETIVSIDNVLGSHITAQLDLGLRLKTFAKEHLRNQDKFRELCCGDPLSWHYKPGSVYRAIYDCVKCNPPYETIVDETGYINRQYDLATDPIDMFMAGDSVLEGVGTPSIVEFLNERLPIKIWNLSSNNYGPRQKANALITFALPHHPKWIVIEFYAANDIGDTAMTESCASTGTFHCLFTVSERERALLNHPMFASMVDKSKLPADTGDIFGEYVEKSFTLAVTRYVVDRVKGGIKGMVGSSSQDRTKDKGRIGGSQRRAFVLSEVSRPGEYLLSRIIPGKRLDWLNQGMQRSYEQYDRLAAEISKIQPPPSVVLLYNPSAYEIYRDLAVDSDRDNDRLSEFQRHAVRDYASKRGWEFIDLTPSLHNEVKRTGSWIYGEFDRVHWSTEGTKVVASVLAREFTRIMEKCSLMPSAGAVTPSIC